MNKTVGDEYVEIRKCYTCGESWQDTGEYECPFCGSDDTVVVEGE